jgi:hypothetical protein
VVRPSEVDGGATASLLDLAGPTSAGGATRALALLGRGSFLQQTVATLKGLCKANGIRGYSKLKKPALAAVLEEHGVKPPPRPLESFSKRELVDLVRQLLEQR